MSIPVTTLVYLFLQSGEQHNDWPQFLGPDRTGKIEHAEFDFDWPEGGPEVLWRLEIGPGYGGPSVRDGEVYLLDREQGEADVLRVLDLESGEELWSSVHPAEGRLNFPGSRTVPTVTEKHVFTLGGFGEMICFDRSERDVAWQVHLGEIYGGVQPDYGWSSSPLIVGDLVVVAAHGEEVGLVAFDQATGEEAWITRPVGISHSSPVLLTLLGQPQVVFVSTRAPVPGGPAPFTISSFDPDDGSLLWETETPLSRYPIPGPVQVDDQRFFVTGGYEGGSSLLRIAQGDDGYTFELLFHIERGAQVHNPILHDDHLYLIVNQNENDQRSRYGEGGLLCLGLDGEEKWRTGAEPYLGRGNAVLAGDHLLIQDGQTGVLRVIRATPESYQLVAEADFFGVEDRRDHRMWAPMALAGRYLLMRSQEELLCVRL